MEKLFRTKKQDVGFKGIYKFSLARLESKKQWDLHQQIERLIKLGQPFMHLVRQLNDICKVEELVAENLIPTVGRAAIANWLTNASPSPASMRLNYTSLGTGTNAPANGDTQLQTETYRKAISSETNSNNIAYATAFYTASEYPPSGSVNIKEAGIFMNATGTANSGTLFSRIAVNITKDTVTTLTIDYTVTLT